MIRIGIVGIGFMGMKKSGSLPSSTFPQSPDFFAFSANRIIYSSRWIFA